MTFGSICSSLGKLLKVILVVAIIYSGVPNKRVVPNSHAGGKTSAKILSVYAQISVQGGKNSFDK